MGFDGGSIFRPALERQPSDDYYKYLFLVGGCSRGGSYWHYKITETFVEKFDLTIVMSDAGFIVQQWDALKSRPIIWRTVGMGVEAQEWLLELQRFQGLKIVRCSPAERRHPAYLGEDCLIRFYKEDVHEWVGSENYVLTFANTFRQRYVNEFNFFNNSVAELPVKVGGSNNDGMEGALGFVNFDEQNALFSRCKAYFYCHGSYIPYTLNFIEAWSSGIPVVALDPKSGVSERDTTYSEIDSLITHGETGFLVGEACEANAILRSLLENRSLGERISHAGRLAAQSIFGKNVVKRQWEDFLSQFSK